jgi:hypothetical protein
MIKVRLKLRKAAAMIACLAVTTMFSGCEKKEDPIDPDAPAFTEFSFTGQVGDAVIDAQKRTVKAVAECGKNIAALTPKFKLLPEGTTAKVDGKLQTSEETTVNFSEPVTYVLTSADGQITAEWTVTITLPDDCPPVSNCENKIFSENALAKMASLGKTIPNERIIVRYSFNSTWGTEMQVYTVPSNDDIEQGVWWYTVRYVFFYCRDYYESEKAKDEQITDILEHDDAGLWYSMEKPAAAMSYQDAYDDYEESGLWEFIE